MPDPPVSLSEHRRWIVYETNGELSASRWEDLATEIKEPIKVMPVSEHMEIVERLASFIEAHCEGVQVYREDGLVVT